MSSPAPIDEPRELLLQRLRMMLWLELRLVEEVLPRLRDLVHAPDLKWALERHELETEEHVENLRRAFDLLHEPREVAESPALRGLEQEHDLALSIVADDRPDVADLVHTDAIARNEHLEIAAYNGLFRLAQALGEDEVAALLRANLEQEEHALEQAQHALVKLLAEQVESA